MRIGKSYYIETATKFWSGRLRAVEGGFLILENAAWIADTGRWTDFLRTGEPDEVEPVPGDGVWSLNMAFVTGYREYPGKLPQERE